MKVLSLFSGIGAFETALDRLKIDYELVNYCEIDKYASKSYSLIHNVSESMNLWDITKVNEKLLPKDIDLLTHGSPCQSFSLAGKQEGGDIGSGTKSSLMWDTVRIVEWCKPKYIIWENVKNLLSKKHRHNFDAYIQEMENMGYNSYYKVLNSKDYGIPQNRERVYTISVRKDIDDGLFNFPKPYELDLRLKDMLEDKVDEKYYLSDKMIKYISFTGTKNFKNPDCKINLDIARPSDNFDLTLLIKNATKKGYLEAEEGDGIDISGRMIYHRGNVQKGMCQTLTTDGGNSRGVVVAAAQRKRENAQQIEVSDREYANAITTVQKDSLVAEIPLKRGYSVDVKEELPDTTDIDIIGNYSKSEYKATPIVGKNGISPTVRENHGQVTAIVEKEKPYSDYSLKKIKNNIVKGDVVGTITANAMQSINHDNCHLVITKNGVQIPLYKDTKQLRETIEKNELFEDKPANLDLYNRSVCEESQTLTDPTHNSQRLWDGLRIRKLTPKECWRLMGFRDENVDKCAKGGISNSQLYKQAGNSIVVDVLEHIFKKLFIDKMVKNKTSQIKKSILDMLE